jgi:prepilin peptidase CpaA
MGLFLSLAFGIFLGGMPRIIYILLNISFPVIVLYLLYLLGVLGAGDIKLFSVIGGFNNFRTLAGCMLAAFVVAAVISVGKMLYNRNLRLSLFKGQLFVKEVLQGNISSYRKTMAEERNLMHFSVAILIGLLIARGYDHLC